MTADDKRRVLEWSRGGGTGREPNLPHRQLRQWAKEVPDLPALRDGDREWTYAALDLAVDGVAAMLGEEGLAGGRAIGVCLDRSAAMVQVFHAVLRAGGVVCLLDPAAPPARLGELIRLLAPFRVVGDPDLAARVPEVCGILIHPEQVTAAAGTRGAPRAEGPADPDALAFLVGTSGSSGEPRFVKRQFGRVRPGPRPAPAAHVLKSDSGTSFTIAEIVRPLACHGILHVAPPGLESDFRALRAFVSDYAIRRLLTTPTQLRGMLESGGCGVLRGLELVEVIGESVSPELVKAFFGMCDGDLRVAYGCTEAPGATARIYRSANDLHRGRVDVGRPLPLMEAYVLDAGGRLCAPCQEGEIHLGGAISPGYAGDPGETALRFVAHPWSAKPEARLFRTGDLGRWNEDGNLEVLGRIDRQVKVRGVRVELGEIEAKAMGHPDVSECAVLVRTLASGEPGLVGYWTGRDSATGPGGDPDLRAFLLGRLPAGMVPSVWCRLAAFPLNASGKIDRRRLPEPASVRAGQGPREAPRDRVEEGLSGIWAGTLGLPSVGRDEDFFELGGQSILAGRILARVEDEWGLRMEMAAFLRAPTVAAMAALIRERIHGGGASSMVQVVRSGSGATPIAFLHTGGGQVMKLAPLMRCLPESHPVLALQSRGLDGVSPPHDTIPAMAGAYVDEIRRLGFDGCVAFVGYSYGAAVAYEMACRLRREGRSVHLVLIDALPPDPPGLGAVARLGIAFVRAGTRAAVRIHDFLAADKERRRTIFGRLARRLGVPVRETNGASAGSLFGDERLDAVSERVTRANEQAIRMYHPGRYGGRVLLIRARDWHGARVLAVRARAGRRFFAGGGLEDWSVAGTHTSILEEPRVSEVAQAIRRFLGEG